MSNNIFTDEEKIKIEYDITSFIMCDLLGFCLCGSPKHSLYCVYQALKIQRERHTDKNMNYSKKIEKIHQIFNPYSIKPANNIEYGYYQFVLYVLDKAELLEHGSSIGGSWLTPKGEYIYQELKKRYKELFGDMYRTAY